MPDEAAVNFEQEAQELAAMVQSEGWRIVRKYIGQQANALALALETEKDYNAILDLQAKLKAFKAVVVDTEQHIEAARRKAAEEISEGPASQAGA